MMPAARTGPVLVVAEELDATADMVVDQLNHLGTPVLRFDAAVFPQHLTLTAGHSPDGWSGVLDDGTRCGRLEEVRAVYWRRPGRSTIAGQVPDPYRTWARDQADCALLNVLSALPVRWINNPHTDRAAAHKPQQLGIAAACGLTVPRTVITNDPEAARKFAAEVGAPIVCKPVLGGRLEDQGERGRMVPTHPVDTDTVDESVRLTGHLFQERIPKAYEVRLTVVADSMFAATIHAGSTQAGQDWRTDYPNLTYSTTALPDDVEAGVRAFLDLYGLTYGAFDFAVTPAGDWVFFECNPAGTWGWVEQRTGLPIAAAHARYLTGDST
jgi:ATP-grasp ribosomal peptide maturase